MVLVTFSSTATAICIAKDIKIKNRIYFPHSLGIFYQSLTQYLGFNHYGDEYKVMGLAPYGKPTFEKKLLELFILKNNGNYKLNLNFFRHHNEDIEFKWDGGSPTMGNLFKKETLENHLGIPPRHKEEELKICHKDLAYSIQSTYEKLFFNYLNKAYEKYKIPRLTLSGGCAMNSVANGKIYRNTKFRKAYIQAAAGDAGGAIGAAFQTAIENGADHKSLSMAHAYWGPSFENKEIQKILNEKKDIFKNNVLSIKKIEEKTELCSTIAKKIFEENVVGWFQGKMEWGPRALGNRSILCDPRNPEMKILLIQKLREESP